MSPKKTNGSWRGPCPGRNLNKSIWSLLGKGIGQRHFRLLTRRVESDFLFYFLVHHAVNMLTMLLKCQFINSGLVSIPKFHKNIILLVIIFILPCVPAKPTPGTHTINGITCHIITCPAGTEAVPCTVDWTTDRCRQCPADKYQEQDNVPSDMKLRCYTVRNTCMPDTQRPVQIGPVSAANPPKCQCDITRNHYQHGDNPDDCRKKICPSKKQLLLNGTCVCKEGRVEDSEGECVWQTIDHTDLTTPIYATTMISSANDSQSAITARPSTSSVPTNEYIESTEMNDKTENVSTGYTPTSSVQTVDSDKNSSTDNTLITLMSVLLVILAIVISVYISVSVYKRINKQLRQKTTVIDVEETDGKDPLIVFNGETVNVQVGSNNTMLGNLTGAQTPPSA